MDSFTYEDRSIGEAVVSLPVHQQTAALPPDVQCSLICHQLHLRVFPDLVDLEVFLLLARSDLALDKGCVSIKQLLLRGAAQLVVQELQYFLSSRIFLLVLRNKTSEFPQYFTYGNLDTTSFMLWSSGYGSHPGGPGSIPRNGKPQVNSVNSLRLISNLLYMKTIF